MKPIIKTCIIWLLASPVLWLSYDYKDIPWYKKTAAVFLSPFFIVFFLFFYGFFALSTADPFETWFEEHEFKNAADLAAWTESYIPPCDTLYAIRQCYGIDSGKTEKFLLDHKLVRKETQTLQKACRQDERWNETDSTFVFSKRRNLEENIRSTPYDYFVLTIPKQKQVMTVEYGNY